MDIQIITLPNEPFSPYYLLYHLMECWQEAGHRVRIGPVQRLDADLGIVHVDRTCVPAHGLPENPHQRPLLNRSVLDIAKARISQQRVLAADACSGPVIIKSNHNAFGLREYQLLPVWSARRLRRGLTRLLPWQWVRSLPRGQYPVLENAARVPAWVWQHPDLIVERFLPEREGDAYVLRSWLFFADQEYSVKLYGRQPVVKAGTVQRYEYLHAVPDRLRAIRREMGMDFGKFDYVQVDGQAILLDVNKTPTVARSSNRRSANLCRLAAGLAAYGAGAAA